MDNIQFQGHWNQIKNKLKEKFGKLTESDFLRISGKRDELIRKLESLYGMNKEKIDQQIREIENAFYSDEFRNHWNQIQTKLKQKWNHLTETDIKHIKGSSDQLLQQLEERYHFNRAKAEAEFHSFIESLTVMSEKVGAHGKGQRR